MIDCWDKRTDANKKWAGIKDTSLFVCLGAFGGGNGRMGGEG